RRHLRARPDRHLEAKRTAFALMRRDGRPEARPQRGRRGEPVGGLRSTTAPPVPRRILLSLDFPLYSQISNRRQNRERLTRTSQPQFIRVCGFLRNFINPPRGRSIP